jgi:hypothetical protein
MSRISCTPDSLKFETGLSACLPDNREPVSAHQSLPAKPEILTGTGHSLSGLADTPSGTRLFSETIADFVSP